MAKLKVTAPVKGLTQKIIGVDFVDSVGETDDENALNYFRRHGYDVEKKAAPKAPAKAPTKPAEGKAGEKAPEAPKAPAEGADTGKDGEAS